MAAQVKFEFSLKLSPDEQKLKKMVQEGSYDLGLLPTFSERDWIAFCQAYTLRHFPHELALIRRRLQEEKEAARVAAQINGGGTAPESIGSPEHDVEDHAGASRRGAGASDQARGKTRRRQSSRRQ